MKTSTLRVNQSWQEIFTDPSATPDFSNKVLPAYLHRMRWFAAKSSAIKRYNIEQTLPYKMQNGRLTYVIFVEVVFQTSNTESYLLPITLAKNPEDDISVICEIKDPTKKSMGFLVDAIYTKGFRNDIYQKILTGKKVKLNVGEFHFSKGKTLKAPSNINKIESKVLKLEQSNSTILYEGKYFLKIYRKLFRDNNPDLELTRFLSEKTKFKNSPKFAGGIEWVREDYYRMSIGLMQEKVENQGEAWNNTLSSIESFFEKVDLNNVPLSDIPKFDLYKPIETGDISHAFRELVGDEFLDKVALLATRTAEMHIALFSEKTDRHFTPETFNSDYTVWLLNRVMYMFDSRFHLLEQTINKLSGVAREYAEYIIDNKDDIKNRILNFDELSLNSSRIRIHGDYHLGQVLITGSDFCILDFEGEPESTIRDRKVKQPPLKDLAGLFRSYHYATYATVFNSLDGNLDLETAMEVGGRLYRAIVGLSLHHYVKTAMENGLNIGYQKEIDFLLRYHIFEKAIYELGYELHSRPDWVIIPLKGIIQILKND